MTVIEWPPIRVASFHMAGLLLGLPFLAGGIALLVFADQMELPNLLRVIAIGCAAIGVVEVGHGLVNFIRVLTKPGRWRISISEGQLHWETAVSTATFPLQMPIDSIDRLVQLSTFARSPAEDTQLRGRVKNKAKITYEIHRTDGSMDIVTQKESGIDPHRAFQKLQDLGIRYQRVTR